MSEEQLLREGDPEGALAALQQRVRQEPAVAKHRIFLFQLLAVLGEWERALNQLGVAAELDASAIAMAQVYRDAVHCEVLRRDVFDGRRSPLFFGDPEEWMAWLVEALRLAAAGKHDAAGSLRDRAFERIPATAGTIDGTAFEWIADADPRLGPLLETVVHGRYYWIPFHRIQCIRIEQPADLRDLVWTPAQFRWANGGEAVGLIPTRYAGTESSPDGPLKLARKTEWVEEAGDVCRGLGQRMLATEAAEYPLLDVRSIDLDTASDAGASGETRDQNG
jgi:type VI secretion system protein ImpE